MPAEIPQQAVNPVSVCHEEAWHTSAAEPDKSSNGGFTGVLAAPDCKPDSSTSQHTSKTEGSKQSFDMLDDPVEDSEQSFDMLDDGFIDGPAAHISGPDQKAAQPVSIRDSDELLFDTTVSLCLLLRTWQQLPQDQQTPTSAQMLAHLESQHHWLMFLLTLAGNEMLLQMPEVQCISQQWAPLLMMISLSCNLPL